MTGEMTALTILYVVYTFGILIVGMILGAFFMAVHIGKALDKAYSNATRKLLASPPLSGDEWKNKDSIIDIPETEDEKWLRRRLDKEDDKNKDKK